MWLERVASADGDGTDTTTYIQAIVLSCIFYYVIGCNQQNRIAIGMSLADFGSAAILFSQVS